MTTSITQPAIATFVVTFPDSDTPTFTLSVPRAASLALTGAAGPPGPLITDLKVVLPSDAPDVDIDVSLYKKTFDLHATVDVTVHMINGVPEADGKAFLLRVTADAGVVVTLAAGDFGYGRRLPSITWSTDGSLDYVGLCYREAVDKLDVVSFNDGF